MRRHPATYMPLNKMAGKEESPFSAGFYGKLSGSSYKYIEPQEYGIIPDGIEVNKALFG